MFAATGSSATASQKANVLVKTLLDGYSDGYGFGSMTVCIYDTAWLSCVRKRSTTRPSQWLFPSSFHHVLQNQATDGAWHWPPKHTGTCGDECILTSLAALYAVKLHDKKPLQLRSVMSSLSGSIDKARAFLLKTLRTWTPSSASRSVDFQILILALLRLLEAQGLDLEFPAKVRLLSIREQKLADTPLRSLTKKPSRLLHSLEAFYDVPVVKFEYVQDHLVQGSVMGSPAATAAYLMALSDRGAWDDSAESYLRLAVDISDGRASGLVPSAFPSMTFELTRVASTLLMAGFGPAAVNPSRLVSTLEREAGLNEGLCGFSPGIQPDLDNTARASAVLSLLGCESLATTMREQFESGGHFRTYSTESGSSISANCNALLALLHDTHNILDHVKPIENICQFLCHTFCEARGFAEDRWNHSPYYTVMVVVQALARVNDAWSTNRLPGFDEKFMQTEVLHVCQQSLTKVLVTQNDDGSWGTRGPREETAYALLALAEFRKTAIAPSLDAQMQEAISKARAFLLYHDEDAPPEYLWIDKVSYGSRNLATTYRLSALHATSPNQMIGMVDTSISAVIRVEPKKMAMLFGMMKSLPLFKTVPEWLLQASFLEGQFMLPKLIEMRNAVFQQPDNPRDRYIEWIPFIWMVMHNLHGAKLSNRFLFDMMLISLIVYQADGFMESAVLANFADNLGAARQLIEEVFSSFTVSAGELEDEQPVSHKSSDKTTNADIDDVRTMLTRFLEFALNHPHIARASAQDKALLRVQLKAFCLAHLSQMEDNALLSSQASQILAPPRQSYQQWLRETAAIHTACPFAFTFASCLTSHEAHEADYNSGADDSAANFFPSLYHSWLASDIVSSLSAMSKMYNDIGSATRDAAAGTVNSINFPEFHDQAYLHSSWPASAPTASTAGDSSTDVATEGVEAGSSNVRLAKRRLKQLAEWERRKLGLAMTEMEAVAEPGVMNMLRVFVDVADLFGQIYVVRDFTTMRKV